MSHLRQVRNYKRLVAPITYMISSEDDVIDVDTTLGLATIYIPNIQANATVDRKIFIADATGNAGANPITIVTIGGNTVNNVTSLALNVNGITAEIGIIDRNRYLANLSTDDSSGGTLTGANNGLNVVSNTVKLGGVLLMPTVITASSVNHLEIVDSFGSFFKTRDANANFSIADFGGNTINSSTNIFSYLSVSNTYDNSNIVVNFGSLGSYTDSTDTWNFGDESIYVMANQSFNFGRANSYTSTINASILGNGNVVGDGSTIRVVGDSNYVNGSDAFIFGSNVSFVGSGGYLIGTNKNIDNTSSTYGTGSIFSFGSVFNIVGGEFVDSIVSLGFSNSINATQETRGVYIFGDSHFINEFVTYSTLIGESCNFTRVDHCTALGIFTSLTDTTNVYTYGEGNTIESSTTITNFGTYNYISNSSNLGVFGNNNTITDTDKLYLGNNNLNVTIDSITGRVLALYPTSLDPLVWGHTFASPSGSAKAFSVGTSGLSQSLFDVYNSGAFEIGHIASAVAKLSFNGVDSFFFGGGAHVSVGVNTTSPTASLHVVGVDTTLANYAIKFGNSINTLFAVRNDNYIGLNGYLSPISGELITMGDLRVNSKMALGSAPLVPLSYSLESAGSLYWADGNQIDAGGIGVRFRAVGDTFQFSNQALNYDLARILPNSSIWTPDSASALTTTTTYDMTIKSSYWNGAIAIQNEAHIKNIATDTVGGYMFSFEIGGSEKMAIRNNGQVNISSLPISAVGLVAGDLWNNLGIVSIV